MNIYVPTAQIGDWVQIEYIKAHLTAVRSSDTPNILTM